MISNVTIMMFFMTFRNAALTALLHGFVLADTDVRYGEADAEVAVLSESFKDDPESGKNESESGKSDSEIAPSSTIAVVLLRGGLAVVAETI